MAITIPFNNYCRVTGVSSDGRTIAYDNKTSNGMALIGAGALVMFHVSKHTDSADMSLLGKFILATVLSDDGNSLTLDTPVSKVFDVINLSKYSCQIISIAQFGNLTINYNYNATTKWDDTKKIGGICAVSCNGVLDLRDGQISVEGKGGGTAYAREGLAFIGNAQMVDILPIGQGHGSVFLLVTDTKANENSRIGATYDGSMLGGSGAGRTEYTDTGGGFSGKKTNSSFTGNPGSGGSGGSGSGNGGYGSNGGENKGYSGGKQGAHIFIITKTINQFYLSMLSTGGGTGKHCSKCVPYAGGASFGAGGTGVASAGAGFVGGGSSDTGNDTGGGGGSGAFAMFYIGEVTEFNEMGVIAE